MSTPYVYVFVFTEEVQIRKRVGDINQRVIYVPPTLVTFQETGCWLVLDSKEQA